MTAIIRTSARPLISARIDAGGVCGRPRTRGCHRLLSGKWVHHHDVRPGPSGRNPGRPAYTASAPHHASAPPRTRPAILQTGTFQHYRLAGRRRGSGASPRCGGYPSKAPQAPPSLPGAGILPRRSTQGRMGPNTGWAGMESRDGLERGRVQSKNHWLTPAGVWMMAVASTAAEPRPSTQDAAGPGRPSPGSPPGADQRATVLLGPRPGRVTRAPGPSRHPPRRRDDAPQQHPRSATPSERLGPSWQLRSPVCPGCGTAMAERGREAHAAADPA